ncbi:MAG: hypothetical protein C3F18_03015 [Nitrosomonadales bacterium]|nr:MAG: hypothetical protein C3F18_03015 [Nitrosomonadales bacterium]
MSNSTVMRIQVQSSAISKAASTPVHTRLLQRKYVCGGSASLHGECAECGRKKLGLQRHAAPYPHRAESWGEMQAVPPIVHEVLRSPGQPLDPATRAFMEPRFGHDFSKVRVHTDTKAAESAGAVNALAYTMGQDVMFGAGQYTSATGAGRRLLAHELTHVVQQGGELQGKVGIGQLENAYEQEADRVTELVMQAQDSQLFWQHAPIPMTSSKIQALQRKSDPNRASPVPQWNQLPAYAQADLMSRYYDQEWFESHDDISRLTVLNMYVKLKGTNLWRFVASESGTGPGTLDFVCTDITGLKNDLRNRDDFTSPEESPAEWSSREMSSRGSLHFKHFKGWPETKVQAHIDQYGLLLRSKWWWLLPIVPLIQMAIHGLTYESYKDAFGVRDILLAQGWDPAPLKGIVTPPA